MPSIAIIGAGISGLTVAHQLQPSNKVVVFEKESTPGGLIRCQKVNGSLFHICGGHVFNTKRAEVQDWFWEHIPQGSFVRAERNSAVFMEDGTTVPYPIENHLYAFPQSVQLQCIKDLLELYNEKDTAPDNFESFLRHRFGETLYQMYFRPYNEKVWRKDLSTIPLSWLDGKLPMPTIEEILLYNFNHTEEKVFVHSTFWYEKENGSQYIADTLAQGIEIRYNTEINHVQHANGRWNINGEWFDKMVFCGNIIEFVDSVQGVEVDSFRPDIKKLEYHGTTAVFCEIDPNPYSWIYQPSREHESHRIICTGNFSPSNNAEGKMTGTIEFTDYISKEDILGNLSRMPLNPHYLSHHYSKYSYPIQNARTRELIAQFKKALEREGCYLTGRFADWEYYNMDAAIGAAIDLCHTIK